MSPLCHMNQKILSPHGNYYWTCVFLGLCQICHQQLLRTQNANLSPNIAFQMGQILALSMDTHPVFSQSWICKCTSYKTSQIKLKVLIYLWIHLLYSKFQMQNHWYWYTYWSDGEQVVLAHLCDAFCIIIFNNAWCTDFCTESSFQNNPSLLLGGTHRSNGDKIILIPNRIQWASLLCRYKYQRTMYT